MYEETGALQIAPGSAAGKLTDQGRRNVFRVCGRDDRQGAKVADYLADNWADKDIANLDDGTVWGLGVTNAARRVLRERGMRIAMDESFVPGKEDYSALVAKMQDAGVDVVFPGGLHRETAPIFRQAHDRGYNLALIANSASAVEEPMASTWYSTKMHPTRPATLCVCS